MSRRVVLALVVAACSSHASEPPDPPIVTPTKAPDPIAVGVPHGGAIVEIAVTEQGDAALTADNLGTLRLWPSLDGKRPPVPIAGVSPDQLALAHAGDELLAAILDEAGVLHLLRVGLDGSVRGRAQLPADTPIQQVVAVDGGVLVRRADQTLERYDARGKLVGKLVPEPGERIGAIAVRNGSAIAEITSELRQDRELRWIVLGENLRWGTSVMLPTPYVPGALALAPDHVHVAVDEQNTTVVYEVVPVVTRVGAFSLASLEPPALGFLDGDQLVAIDRSSHKWWSAKAASDPWSPQHDVASETEAGAVGNGVALSGYGAALLVEDGAHRRYLGWSQLANGDLLATPDGGLYITNGTQVTWLDDRLQETRTVDLKLLATETPYGTVLDDRHVLMQMSRGDQWQAEIVDVTDPKADRIKLGSSEAYALVQYRPESHTLYAGRNDLKRWRLDFATHSATELPAVPGKPGATTLFALDPARAHGAVALVQAYAEEDLAYHMRAYVEGQDGAIEPGKDWKLVGSLVALDAAGNTYMAVAGEPTLRRVAVDGTSAPSQVPSGDMYATTISRDGTQLATLGKHTVRLIEIADGRVRWQYPVWAATNVAFTRDGTQLVLRATNGQIVLDVATGKRLSTTCGWDFGLHDDPPAVTTFGIQPACED